MTHAHLAALPSHLRHIVLVVGNTPDDDTEVVTILLQAGFDAVAVESASATLALIAGGAAPCVLLLDIDAIPDVDIRRLWDEMRGREEASRPAVVLVSHEHADAPQARGVDIEDFLRKPLEPERLVEAVERHCPRRLFPKFTSADER